jgi:hypothetical protein
LSLSSPFKCSLFCFLVSFFFSKSFSLFKTLFYVPRSVSLYLLLKSPPPLSLSFFFCFSPLYSLFFFSRP